MGPRSGLSLRGGTGYPAPYWNLELGTRVGLTTKSRPAVKQKFKFAVVAYLVYFSVVKSLWEKRKLKMSAEFKRCAL